MTEEEQADANRERLMTAVADFSEAAMTVGLHSRGIMFADTAPWTPEPELSAVVVFTIGDFAWSDAVQDPDGEKIKHQLNVMEQSQTLAEFEQIKRMIAEGKDPTKADENLDGFD